MLQLNRIRSAHDLEPSCPGFAFLENTAQIGHRLNAFVADCVDQVHFAKPCFLGPATRFDTMSQNAGDVRESHSSARFRHWKEPAKSFSRLSTRSVRSCSNAELHCESLFRLHSPTEKTPIRRAHMFIVLRLSDLSPRTPSPPWSHAGQRSQRLMAI